MRGTIDHVWENETKGHQKYLTVQMNGQRYSIWDSKYFDSIQEGATINYDLKQSGNFTHLVDIEPVNGNPGSLPRRLALAKAGDTKSTKPLP